MNNITITGDFTVGNDAFRECINLGGEIRLPSCTGKFNIGTNAFRAQSATSLVLPTFTLNYSDQPIDPTKSESSTISGLFINTNAFYYSYYLQSIDFSNIKFDNHDEIITQERFEQLFFWRDKSDTGYSRMFVPVTSNDKVCGTAFGNLNQKGDITKETVYIPSYASSQLKNITEQDYLVWWNKLINGVSGNDSAKYGPFPGHEVRFKIVQK